MTPSTSVNTAVVAPIPSVNVTTATTVKPGERASPRRANRKSFHRPVIVRFLFQERQSVRQGLALEIGGGADIGHA